ncbi:Methionine-R-sulfoxide reductase B1 [Amphibalanus amphitrite]|uniref:Peptide-methionine (R)-S-oxide reductase n=1 Tax=Amphibalanus amphitrite TaxID=1232801 RepID=A0A6A4W2Y9_AMPAM|nr:Methionine-R-sulfoxide reductase B1 [Amphibalanus amphitrite]
MSGSAAASGARSAADRLRSKDSSPAIGTVCFDPATLKKRLTPLQHHITQDKATERAFSGRFNKHREPGIYRCIVCRQDLFSSATKYDSGSGWPSFYDVIDPRRVTLKADLSHVGGNILLLVANPGMERTEVSCARCGAHLGHLFKDGPKPTGNRYCVNSESLDFRRDDSIDVLDRVEFAKGSCGELSGSCGAPPRPSPRATAPSAAISRVVEKYNSLGGAGSGASPSVNGQSTTNGSRRQSDGVAHETNGKT